MRLIDDTHDAAHQWNDVHRVKFQFTRQSASQVIDATRGTSTIVGAASRSIGHAVSPDISAHFHSDAQHSRFDAGEQRHRYEGTRPQPTR
jgi:hypothetical protein